MIINILNFNKIKKNTIKPSYQIYSNYTREDFDVWETLYVNQMKVISNKVTDEFINGLKILDFNASKIPNFNEVNSKLKKINGWGIKTVPNITEAKEFFSCLAKKKFTSTCWLRSYSEIDYLEEPDMFHDVFAHIPMIIEQSYANFFQNIGKLALAVINDENKLKKIQRLYWFTIEFGLMNTPNGEKVYGAGIISSKKELENVYSKNSIKKQFDISAILNKEYRIDKVQNEYFVIESFDQLSNSLEEVQKELGVIV